MAKKSLLKKKFLPINTSLRGIDYIVESFDENIRKKTDLCEGLILSYSSFLCVLLEEKEPNNRKNVYYYRGSKFSSYAFEIIAISTILKKFYSKLEKTTEQEIENVLTKEVRFVNEFIGRSAIEKYALEAIDYHKGRPFSFIARILCDKDKNNYRSFNMKDEKFIDIGKSVKESIYKAWERKKIIKEPLPLSSTGKKNLDKERDAIISSLRGLYNQKYKR